MKDRLPNSEFKSETGFSKITRVAILTQEDSFVIPENINILSKVKNIDIVAVIKIDSSGYSFIAFSVISLNDVYS